MKPYEHAQTSVRRWGGKPEDYLPIHDFIDESKAHFPDMRHRALLHNSWGIYLCERIFGHNINIATCQCAAGSYETRQICDHPVRKVSVRDIAEQHIIEDMGRIPTLQDYFQGMPFYEWLGGPKRKRETFNLRD